MAMIPIAPAKQVRSVRPRLVIRLFKDRPTEVIMLIEEWPMFW